jgi:DNA modification methylase
MTGSLLSRLPEILEDGRAAASSALGDAAPSLRTEALVIPASNTNGDASRGRDLEQDTATRRRLIHGDNLPVMAALLRSGDSLPGPTRDGVDLIYIDPPFGSGVDYRTRTAVPARGPGGPAVNLTGHAYTDRWTDSAAALAYLVPRFVLARELLKPSGLVCVHLDRRLGHHAKVLLDEIFGAECLVNEIIWRYGKMSNARRRFPQNHDTLYLYAKDPARHFFAPVRHAESEYKTRFARFLTGGQVRYGAVKHSTDQLILRRIAKLEGRLGRPLTDPDVLFDFNTEFKVQDDVFYDIPIIKGNAAENLGFDTQKPERLIQRIIEACCPPGGLVADLFSGSGTAPAVADRLGREWLAVEKGRLGAALARRRLIRQGSHPFACLTLPPTPVRPVTPVTPAMLSPDTDPAAPAPPGPSLQVTVSPMGPGLNRSRVVLLGYSPAEPGLPAGWECSGDFAAQVREDPLGLIEHWEIDPDFDGAVFRSRWQGGRALGSGTEAVLDLPGRTRARTVCVRTWDVFGHECEARVAAGGDRAAPAAPVRPSPGRTVDSLTIPPD